jgi:hypothetical protein
MSSVRPGPMSCQTADRAGAGLDRSPRPHTSPAMSAFARDKQQLPQIGYTRALEIWPRKLRIPGAPRSFLESRSHRRLHSGWPEGSLFAETHHFVDRPRLQTGLHGEAGGTEYGPTLHRERITTMWSTESAHPPTPPQLSARPLSPRPMSPRPLSPRPPSPTRHKSAQLPGPRASAVAFRPNRDPASTVPTLERTPRTSDVLDGPPVVAPDLSAHERTLDASEEKRPKTSPAFLRSRRPGTGNKEDDTSCFLTEEAVPSARPGLAALVRTKASSRRLVPTDAKPAKAEVHPRGAGGLRLLAGPGAVAVGVFCSAATCGHSTHQNVIFPTQAGRGWVKARALLWRVLDPAAAFSNVVRRALFVHRVLFVLRQQPVWTATQQSATSTAPVHSQLPQSVSVCRDAFCASRHSPQQKCPSSYR